MTNSTNPVQLDDADRDAVIVGPYRYYLSRTWDRDLPVMVFVMLNPSTADALVDDPTITRCVSFAKREGCGSLVVVNLFAWRATKPRELPRWIEAIGPDNGAYLEGALRRAKTTGGKVVVGWGAHDHPILMGTELGFLKIADKVGVELLCLGSNANGSPKHPLYIHGDTPLVLWRAS